jgi:energy-coupling factor transport system substrate-specific component
MTWQLASFAVLGVGLAGGFAWYERSKPDARIIALVATLAAFAALGRIAFAALPNVKPTTDIVLLSGYALGGGPGFVVGALAGLTSNFFFGQGPWTPWQMAAWGATGLIGAGLAPLTGRHIGRLPLALVCAAVGFAFAATQDLGDWVTYSDHSSSQLGVYLGKGVGFDVIHAAGCLAFALAFGPALRRSIERYARRLQVTWRPTGAAVVPVLLVVIASAALLAGQPGGIARATAAQTPAGYLLGAQHADGGFGSGPGDSSSQLYAGWAALGLAAEGHNPADIKHGGQSLLAYIESGARSLPDTGALERTILVARAAGVSPRSFGGVDLASVLEHRIRHDGSLSDQVNWTAFGVMALRASGVAPPARMLAWLSRQESADGGFGFAANAGGSDPDDTGAALEALGSRAPRAVAYLRRQQNVDGGFPSTPGGFSNAQSTAFAVQGLLAAHASLGSLRHGSPLRYLSALSAADGHIRYSRSSDQTPVWVTSEALPALASKPLPLAPVPRAVRRAPRAPAARHATSTVTTPTAPATTAPRHHRRAKAATKPATGAAAATSNAERLVVAAGVLTAIVLAPVGVG